MATITKLLGNKTQLTGILVEIDEKHLQVNNPVLVAKDWQDEPIGIAHIVKNENGLIANMEVKSDHFDDRLTPAIGYRINKKVVDVVTGSLLIQEGQLYAVSLSTKPNVDSRIKSIKEQLAE